MSTRAPVGRYARALLDVASSEGNPEQVEQELAAFAKLVATAPDLQQALTNPAIPVSVKRGILEALIARAKFAAPLPKLLLLLADRDQLSLLGELATMFRERLMEYRQVVRAEVTTAVALSPERVTEFERRLAQATGSRIAMTTRVDPSLIGGAVTRVGSVVYDGSVATQLAKIRERLEHTH